MISHSLCRANAPDLAEQVAKNVTLLTLLKTKPLNIVTCQVMRAGQLMARFENRSSCTIESHTPANDVNKKDKAALYALLASSWIRKGDRWGMHLSFINSYCRLSTNPTLIYYS